MSFRVNAAGHVVTFGNGESREVTEKEFSTLLRRQLLAKCK